MSWKPSDYPFQQAARGIVAHYEGEAWKWPGRDRLRQPEFDKRVDEVAHLLAAAEGLRAACVVALITLQQYDEAASAAGVAIKTREISLLETALALAEPKPKATEGKTCTEATTPNTA